LRVFGNHTSLLELMFSDNKKSWLGYKQWGQSLWTKKELGDNPDE